MAHYAYLLMLLLSSLLILSGLQGTHAVQYKVINNVGSTPGGIRFTNEIGIEYSESTLAAASEFIWQTFGQTSLADRMDVQLVSMIVDDINGKAYTDNNRIHVSARYIASYSGDDVKTEITGVLYHEVTHIWQWTGMKQAPKQLIEGIADYIQLKAGYAESDWVKPGEGKKWDDGYDVTARFLDYCNSLRDGFVAELNAKMRTGYSPQIFVDLLGKKVNRIWSDYKAKYTNSTQTN
ncbi:Plant basic secretory protein (BSP) family protein [Thalictrum thalictroides]|uniref:Plant basic secretory protein (BSP) family protein n=1 Tax=Thalictrum thalictroides TaxID=46969 RepID=A0A7J6WP80_THATH|nr:Plant basic secretory protein (BSP) family protein [Thalictrum thalictroides]